MRILFAGGSSGGHLYPGIALAQILLKKFPEGKVLFVTAKRAFISEILKDSTFDFQELIAPKRPCLGPNLFVFPFRFFSAIRRSQKIIKCFKPDVVFGLGGYDSLPLLFAAKRLRIFSALNEQNVLPGMANKFVAKKVNKIYTQFEDTSKSLPCAGKISCLGNPVRPFLCEASEKLFEKESLNILIQGGSQGSEFINTKLPPALLNDAGLAGQMKIRHLSGAKDTITEIQSLYTGLNSPAQVEVKGYSLNVAEHYAWADLAICRAGATTISELLCQGLPALFIPHPGSADYHQYYNAKAIEKLGAGQYIEEKNLTPKSLKTILRPCFDNRKHLKQMRQSALENARAKAAENIIDNLYESALPSKK